MRSDGIVSRLHLALARGIIGGLRPALAAQRLREIEPALAAYLDDEHREILKRLEDARVPDDLFAAIARRQLTALLTAVEAVRHANYALWEDTAIGWRLAQSDPALADLEVLADFKAAHRDAVEGSGLL